MKHGKIIFVAGTDTNVGKTVLSLLLMRSLSGQDAVYLKPVQTGCTDPDVNSDPAFLHRHLPGGLPHGMTPADCIHSCRPLPKAPLFSGEQVNFNNILHFIAFHADRHDIVVVEGAGGVLVPVTEERLMLDLGLQLRASFLVAGRAGLGTINHTLLTLEAITARNGNSLGVVLLDPADAVSELDRSENTLAISRFSDQPVHGVIGHIPDLRHPDSQSCHIVQKILQNLHVTA